MGAPTCFGTRIGAMNLRGVKRAEARAPGPARGVHAASTSAGARRLEGSDGSWGARTCLCTRIGAMNLRGVKRAEARAPGPARGVHAASTSAGARRLEGSDGSWEGLLALHAHRGHEPAGSSRAVERSHPACVAEAISMPCMGWDHFGAAGRLSPRGSPLPSDGRGVRGEGGRIREIAD